MSKCPYTEVPSFHGVGIDVYRGVPISIEGSCCMIPLDNYIEVSSFQGNGILEVSSFQGNGILELSSFQEIGMEWFHCI